MPSHEFVTFITEMGMRKEIAQVLWDADIQTPQELAVMDPQQLGKVCSNPLLQHLHSILHKYAVNITMDKDPYKKALAIVKKHAMTDDDVVDATQGISAGSTVSDAIPHKRSARPSNGGPTGATARQQPSTPKNTAAAHHSTNSTRMQTTDGRPSNGGPTGATVHQQRFTPKNTAAAHYSNSFTRMQTTGGGGYNITIAGGNFFQPSILNSGSVTQNNTNTVINTSSMSNPDLKKRRAKFLNDTLFLNGTVIRASDLQWMDRQNFWIDDINIPRSDFQTYSQHQASDDVYAVRNHGESRALILNNINFRTRGMSTRTGADKDCRRMEDMLTKLGFKVRRENDKTAAEMKELLQEFANSRENMKVDMTVVYIGSHGERDLYGNDTFVGVDGERIKFSDVKEMFSPANCSLLYNKPKLFFLQFCRQDDGRNPVPAAAPIVQTARHVGSDARGVMGNPAKAHQEPIPAVNERRPMDMLCVYATLAGSKAYRDTRDGSWFVTALVKVFTDSAHRDDLLSMLTKVNNSVSVKEGMENDTKALQMSEVVNTLRKKVFFYPGLDA